jgi:large conductance mechanosensitive channel
VVATAVAVVTMSGKPGSAEAASRAGPFGGNDMASMHSAGEAGAKAAAAAKGMVAEFKAFLVKNNVLALAVGVVIGAAVGKVVSGIVDDIIMPIVGVLMPGGEWRSAEVVLSGKNAIKYGDLLGRLIDFTIVAAVVFFILKAFIREQKPAPAAPTKTCPQCLETVPEAAKKCRACASAL